MSIGPSSPRHGWVPNRWMLSSRISSRIPSPTAGRRGTQAISQRKSIIRRPPASPIKHPGSAERFHNFFYSWARPRSVHIDSPITQPQKGSMKTRCIHRPPERSQNRCRYFRKTQTDSSGLILCMYERCSKIRLNDMNVGKSALTTFILISYFFVVSFSSSAKSFIFFSTAFYLNLFSSSTSTSSLSPSLHHNLHVSSK